SRCGGRLLPRFQLVAFWPLFEPHDGRDSDLSENLVAGKTGNIVPDGGLQAPSCSPLGRVEDRYQRSRDCRIACKNIAVLENAAAALRIGNQSASLSHDQYAGCQVPRLQAMLPVAVEAPRCRPRQIERRRTRSADPGNLPHECFRLPQKAQVSCPAAVRNAGGNHRIRKSLACSYSDPTVVQECTLALFCRIHLI